MTQPAIGAPASPTSRPVAAPTIPMDLASVRKRFDEAFAQAPGPLPPAGTARDAWIARERVAVKAMERDFKVVEDAWFAGKLSMDEMGSIQDRMVDRKWALERAVAPPASTKPAAGAEGCPDYLSPGLARFVDRNQNNVGGALGAIFLPVTAIVDLQILLGKISGACEKAQAQPATPKGK